jgi:hypothetical protein
MFWLVLVLGTGFAMFGVKYAVQSLEDELNRIKKATITEEHSIRTNEAEWAYLTRPETLDEMNRRYLSLGPIATKQLRITFADLPLRPQPSLAAEPSPVVASLPESGTGQPGEPAPLAAPATELAAAAPEAPVTIAVPEKAAHATDLVKRTPPKTTVKPAVPLPRPRTLDELIAQVAASR